MQKEEYRKLLKQGWRILRASDHDLTIRIMSLGEYSHGWKVFQKGFLTTSEMYGRMFDLLTEPKTIEG